jgi:hypothetical protein
MKWCFPRVRAFFVFSLYQKDNTMPKKHIYQEELPPSLLNPEATPILAKLHSRPTPPPEYQVLRKYPRRSVSQCLGIAMGFWCNIINGTRPVSKRLHNKIMQLIQDIEQEKKISEAGLLETVEGEGGLN